MLSSEQAGKNLDLAFEVIRQVIAEPNVASEVDELSAYGKIVLYDAADEGLTTANDRMADDAQARDERVVRVTLERRLTLNPR
jgi:hypothetical protein